MKAIQLFESAKRLPPGEQTRHLSQRLPEVLAGGRLIVWNPENVLHPTRRRTLLGVALYDRLDMELLDSLSASPAWQNEEERIEVFDVLGCRSMEEFNTLIPGIGRVIQSPVLGIWENGVLIQKASGYPARAFLIDRFNLAL